MKIIKGISFLLTAIFLTGCIMDDKTAKTELKDYYDLETELTEIGNIVENNDIVIIGESTHWSEEIAEEKMKIIDYLAEKYDFNKLFLETPDSEFNYYKASEMDMKDGVNYQYQQELFSDVINGTHENITMLPMDWTPLFSESSPTTVSVLEENITEEISMFNQELAEEFKRSEYAFRDWFSKGMYLNQSVGNFEREKDVYRIIQDEFFFNELSEPAQNYIISRSENIEKYANNINFDNAMIDYYDYREIGMADKVLSQMEDGDKAIIWVANGHSNYEVADVKHTNEVFISERRDERTESLGALLRESQYDVYNIGLYYNEADSYQLLPDHQGTPRKTGDESLEGYIGDRIQNDVFIDLETSDFVEDKMYQVFVIGDYEYNIVPVEQYDGLIYLDQLEN